MGCSPQPGHGYCSSVHCGPLRPSPRPAPKASKTAREPGTAVGVPFLPRKVSFIAAAQGANTTYPPYVLGQSQYVECSAVRPRAAGCARRFAGLYGVGSAKALLLRPGLPVRRAVEATPHAKNCATGHPEPLAHRVPGGSCGCSGQRRARGAPAAGRSVFHQNGETASLFLCTLRKFFSLLLLRAAPPGRAVAPAVSSPARTDANPCGPGDLRRDRPRITSLGSRRRDALWRRANFRRSPA